MIHRRTATVAIYDTDASGLIYFGAPARWFSDGEQELLSAIGMNFPMADSARARDTSTQPSAPTRAYEVSIAAPLHFNDRYVHETWISRVGRTSFDVSHRITKGDVVCVTGVVHRVYVIVDADGAMTPAPVPDVIRAAVCEGPTA